MGRVHGVIHNVLSYYFVSWQPGQLHILMWFLYVLAVEGLKPATPLFLGQS